MTNGLQQLVAALQGGKSSRSSEQLNAIQLLPDTMTGWSGDVAPTERSARCSNAGANWDKMWDDRLLKTKPSPVKGLYAPSVPTPSAPMVPEQPAPRVQEAPLSKDAQPIAHHTCSTRVTASPPNPTAVPPTAPA